MYQEIGSNLYQRKVKTMLILQFMKTAIHEMCQWMLPAEVKRG